MATLEEKQKELDTLQTAFDEYIASSRELEEELDAELTKCQNELVKAESRSAALASQMANLRPQLTSLQSKLSSAVAQLSSETRKRVAAEIRSEEAENKLRESEGALAAMRSSGMRKLEEENEELCERLAFLENELMDRRNEMDSERERPGEETEELKGGASVLKSALRDREEENLYLWKTAQDDGGRVCDNEVAEQEREGKSDLLKIAKHNGNVVCDNGEVLKEQEREDVGNPFEGDQDNRDTVCGYDNEVPEHERENDSDLVNNDQGISIVSDNDDASEQETTPGDSAESIFVNEAESSPPSSVQESANDDQDKYIRTSENGLKRATRHLALEKPKFSKMQIEVEEATASNSKSTDSVTVATAALYTNDQWQNKEVVLESIIKRLKEENAHLLGKLKRLEEDSKPDLWWFGPFTGCIR